MASTIKKRKDSFFGIHCDFHGKPEDKSIQGATLKEEDIMETFMAESFSYSPTPQQQALFREVLEWSREEDDLG